MTKVNYHGWTNPLAELGHDANGGVSGVIGFGPAVSEREHRPYLCKPLPGSLHDFVRVDNVVTTLRWRDYRKLRLVMDRGLLSQEITNLARGGLPPRGVGPWMGLGDDRPGLPLVGRGDGTVRARGEDLPGVGVCPGDDRPPLRLPRVRVAVVVNPRRKAEAREARDLTLLEWGKGAPDPGRHRGAQAGDLVTEPEAEGQEAVRPGALGVECREARSGSGP